MTDQRPNFYALLDLDPNVEDWSEIQKTIEEQKKRWNMARTQRTGQKRAEAEAKLGWVEEMKRTLGDSRLRQREAEARRSELAAAKQSAFEELDRRIDILRSIGGCSPEQADKLVLQFAGRLDRKEIEGRLQTAGMSVGAQPGTAKAPFVPRSFLSDSDLDEIQHALATISAADLYAFLGASADTSSDELATLAERKYKESLGKVDPNTTIAQKLAGIAQALFRKPGGKERYDASVATLNLRRLHSDIDLMVEAGSLRFEAFDLLAQLASAQGIDRELTKSYVGWYAGERGWSIAEPVQQDTPGPNLDQFMARMEETFRRLESERRAAEEQLAEERRRMEEVVKNAAAAASSAAVNSAAAAEAAAAARSAARAPGPRHPSEPPVQGLQAPSALQVGQLGEGGFRLHWPKVTGDDLVYRVVRKRGSYPQNGEDGELRTSVTGLSFDDASVPPGDWFYAVFTSSRGRTSPHAALSGPHRLRKKVSWSKAAAAAILFTAGSGAAYFWFTSLSSTPPLSSINPPVVVESTQSTPPSHVYETLPNSESSHQNSPNKPPAAKKPKAAATSAIAAVPPPPGPAKKKEIPRHPRVAVLASGDHQIGPVLADRLVRELSARGLDVVGRRSLVKLDGELDKAGRASLARLMSASSHDGIDILVLAEIDRLGERELRFAGRSELAISSRVGVQAYLVAEQRSMGREASDEFEFTQVNLSKVLEKSVYGIGSSMLRDIDSGWADYRQKQGLAP